MADDVADQKRRRQEKGGAKLVREVESRVGRRGGGGDLSPVGGREEESSSIGHRESDSSPSEGHGSPTLGPVRMTFRVRALEDEEEGVVVHYAL